MYHSKQLQEGLTVFSDDLMHFLKIKKKIVEFTKTILKKNHHYYMKHFLLVTKKQENNLRGGGRDRVKILKTREQNIIHEAHNVDEWKYVRQMKTINHHWIQIKCWKKKKA